MSLSPWDLSGNISFDFSLYRPRRPSYVFATQIARRRNESYRHATKSESNSGETDKGLDFIEGIQRSKKRKDSYKAATSLEEIELSQVELSSNHVRIQVTSASDTDLDKPCCSDESPARANQHHVRVVKHARTRPIRDGSLPRRSSMVGGENREPREERSEPADSGQTDKMLRPSTSVDLDSAEIAHAKWRYRKNLVVLSLSFILVFSAFRSIQNLQSSLNAGGKLGIIAMGFVHGTMFLTCLFAPVLINKLTSKWTIVLGLLFYLFWIAANFYPRFYTLIPTSIGVGFGQSLAWGAQVTYIQKLAVDYAHVSKELTQQELFKFNGVFLACFQTSHVWGNLVSSLMLNSEQLEMYPDLHCGMYDVCDDDVGFVPNVTSSGKIYHTALQS